MLQWLAENVEGVLALLTILAAVVSLLTKAGAIQKQRGEILTQLLEDSAGVAKRTLDQFAEARKHGQLTEAELAAIDARGLVGEERKKAIDEAKYQLTNLAISEAFAKALKGEARERAIKSGVKAVLGAVNDGAARVDPDPAKVERPVLRKLGSLLRARFLGR
jgi:hypothetical protein